MILSIARVFGAFIQFDQNAKCDRSILNSSSSEQNGRHFADNIFKYIFMNKNLRILMQISLKFLSRVAIDNKSVLG